MESAPKEFVQVSFLEWQDCDLDLCHEYLSTAHIIYNDNNNNNN